MPSPAPTSRPGSRRPPGFAALPAIAGGLAAFTYRSLLSVDTGRLAADPLLEWFTRPDGLWFPLVLAGSAFLGHRRAHAFLALPERRDRALACAALLAATTALVWARLTGVTDLLVWSCAFLLAACAAWRRGTLGLRVLALPILFLSFALAPPPRLVSEALWWIQSQSARAATALTQALGAPVLGEGIVLSTPTQVFGIVESCAALGMLIVLTAIALLLRERVTSIGRRSWVVVLLAPVVALAINLVRITSIVLHPPLNRIHHLGQWAILLSVGSALLLVVLALLARTRAEAPAPQRAPVAAMPRQGPLLFASLALLALVSLTPTPEPSWWDPAESLATIPAERDGWTSRDVPVDRTFLGLVQFRRVVARSYTREADEVDLFVGESLGRHPGTSPFSAKTILLGLRWVPLASERSPRALELPRPPDQTVLQTRAGERWWVAQWRFGDPGIVRESLRQLLALDASPFASPATRRVVRIAAPLDPERPDALAPARRIVADFARSFEAELFGTTP